MAIDDGAAQTLRRLQAEFSREVTYLNTASLGLPPRRCLDAVQAELALWASGRARTTDYDAFVESSRDAFAGLVRVEPESVAVGSQVSIFVGLVAASLPAGSEVLVAEGDFTSVLFPFLSQAARGVVVREVPLEHLPAAVTATTALVAVSAVQSADGRLVDLDALAAAVRGTSTRVLLDITQAAGWLPIDAGQWSYTVCGGYKWLLAPRGTCFFTVRPEDRDSLTPHNAGWYAGEDPWASIYGLPLRLAPSARRFDTSPAWLSWVGQAASLSLLAEVGTEALHQHAVHLSERFLRALDLPATGSAIVSLPVPPAAEERLRAEGVAVALRAGKVRFSFHVSTTEDDVDRAVQVVRQALA